MKKKNEAKEERLSRRKALKRIAAVFAGAAAGTGLFGKVPQAWAYVSTGYISIEGSYADVVYVDNRYVNRGPSYNDYVSFYTSYSSHRPPPSPYGR